MTNDQIEILKRHSDALTNDVKNIRELEESILDIKNHGAKAYDTLFRTATKFKGKETIDMLIDIIEKEIERRKDILEQVSLLKILSEVEKV